MDRTPAEVLSEIGAVKEALRKKVREFSDASDALVDLEVRYEKERARIAVRLFNEAKEKGERIPAEDIRTAIAHSEIEDGLWSSYLKKKAEVEGIKKTIGVMQSVLSAAQSELQFMRLEYAQGS